MKAVFKAFDPDFSLEKCKAAFDAGTIDRDSFKGYSKAYWDPSQRINGVPEMLKNFARINKV